MLQVFQTHPHRTAPHTLAAGYATIKGMPALAAQVSPGSYPADPVLVARDLAFGYETGNPVIDNLTAQLRRSRITVLLGPNAAGKTTLVRLLLGQLVPQQGRIDLLGQPIRQLAPAARATRLSYVPQRADTSFLFTVEQIVEMGRFAHGSSREAVRRAIDLTELEGLTQRIFAHLSGGQQQRVLLARAIAQSHGTGVGMLLDEPAAAMDLHHIHHTMRLLRQIADRGLAVLVVLHDLNLAARYADDVWLLDGGRLIAEGTWSEVLTPAALEPVYGVKLSLVDPPQGNRPLFFVNDSDTL